VKEALGLLEVSHHVPTFKMRYTARPGAKAFCHGMAHFLRGEITKIINNNCKK
jgi:hypothetical protein